MCYQVDRLKRTGKGEFFARAVSPADAFWFEGHFPGDPVLPGIGQLGIVVAVLKKSLGSEVSVSGLSRVKFKRLVRPGEMLDISITPGKTADSYTFNISTGKDEPVSSGMIKITGNFPGSLIRNMKFKEKH